MQTKLLIAALAASSVNAVDAEAQARDDAAEARLISIYETCKVTIEGLDFQVYQDADDKEWHGRAVFSLLDYADCVDLRVTTSVNSKDATADPVEYVLTDAQVATLVAGDKVSIDLFQQTHLSALAKVQVKVEPKDLECAIPFDVVEDSTTQTVECEAKFTKLDGDISCKGGVCTDLTSELNHNYSFDVSNWNPWACQGVEAKLVVEEYYNNEAQTQRGTKALANSAVQSFTDLDLQMTEATKNFYESAQWTVTFNNAGTTMEFLQVVVPNPHPKCSVKGDTDLIAAANSTLMGIAVNSITSATAAYSCNTDLIHAVDVIKTQDGNELVKCSGGKWQNPEDCSSFYKHSLSYYDLPQKFTNEVVWSYMLYTDDNQVGSAESSVEATNPCDFSIESLVVSNERQPDFSQLLSVNYKFKESVSCPRFQAVFSYYEVGKDTKDVKAFKTITDFQVSGNVSNTVPEFFGTYAMEVVLSTMDGKVVSKTADSNHIIVQPEACVVTADTKVDSWFDAASDSWNFSWYDTFTASDHWCSPETQRQSGFTDSGKIVVAAIDFVKDESYLKSIKGDANHKDAAFCYQRNVKITSEHEEFSKYGQKGASAEHSFSKCFKKECDVHSNKVSLTDVLVPVHELHTQNYILDLTSNNSFEVEGRENCVSGELIATYKVEFSSDKSTFNAITQPVALTEAELNSALDGSVDLRIANVVEEEGWYRIVTEFTKTVPSAFEQPIKATSNVKYHKPTCEFTIDKEEPIKVSHNEAKTEYLHEFNFTPFANKWCVDQKFTGSIVTPLGTTVHGGQNEKLVHQTVDFVNGEYVYTLDLSYGKGESKSFPLTQCLSEADDWCSTSWSETLTVNPESETWNSIDLKARVLDLKFDKICESPAGLFEVDGEKSAVTLKYSDISPNSIKDHSVKRVPTSQDYDFCFEFSTHAENGYYSKQCQTLAYVQKCKVSNVNISVIEDGIVFGATNDVETEVHFFLRGDIDGNCGDNIKYTVDYVDSPSDTSAAGVVGQLPDVVGTSIDVSKLDNKYVLKLDGRQGHDLDITYTINAANAPRQDGTVKGSDTDKVTVKEPKRCEVDIVSVENIKLEENQFEELELQYKIKCSYSKCDSPYMQFTVKDSLGNVADKTQKLTGVDMVACATDAGLIVSVQNPNDEACYYTIAKIMDTNEPAFDREEQAIKNCNKFAPVCKTSVVVFEKLSQTVNFDETKVGIDMHIKLESHKEAHCDAQTAIVEMIDQNGKVELTHYLDYSQILAAKDKGFTMTAIVNNYLDVKYTAKISYADESSLSKPAEKQINVYTFKQNEDCKMTSQRFALKSAVAASDGTGMICEFDVLLQVSEACKADFNAAFTLMQDEQLIESYVIKDSSSMYRLYNEDTVKTIQIMSPTVLTGVVYGQLEMTSGSVYEVVDSTHLDLAL